MTDEAKALIERLRSGRWLGETTCGPAADLIETLETQLESANEALRERLDICETQAREIERLRGVLGALLAGFSAEPNSDGWYSDPIHSDEVHPARAALAGDSHD